MLSRSPSTSIAPSLVEEPLTFCFHLSAHGRCSAFENPILGRAPTSVHPCPRKTLEALSLEDALSIGLDRMQRSARPIPPDAASPCKS